MILTACPDGYYGDCQQRCGHCLNPICNKTTGACSSGCVSGYTGPLCQLGRKTFSQVISSQLLFWFKQNQKSYILFFSNLLINVFILSTGYQSAYYCFVECPSGSYGDNCSLPCSSHCVGQECHHINGTCTSGCAPGYDFIGDQLCNTRQYLMS